MSTLSLSSVSVVDQSHLLCLSLIELLQDGVYRVELRSKDGSIFSTISRVSEVDVGSGEVIQEINFDSEEYGKLMMRGLILSQPISQAIGAFHKAQVQSSARPAQS
jgi:hypothetical protein